MLRKLGVLILGFLLLVKYGFGSYEEAYRLYVNNDISGAVYVVTQDISKGIKDKRSYVLLIDIYVEKLKDYKRALEVTMEALRYFPESKKELVLKLSKVYYLLGNYNNVSKILENYNEEFPGDPNALNLLGLIHFKESRYHKAVVAFKSALAFGYDKSDIYKNLGIALEKIGDYHESLKMLSKYYNTTRDIDIVSHIINISTIIGVDYSKYLSLKEKVEKEQAIKQNIVPIKPQPVSQNSSKKQLPVTQNPVVSDLEENRDSSQQGELQGNIENSSEEVKPQNIVTNYE